MLIETIARINAVTITTKRLRKMTVEGSLRLLTIFLNSLSLAISVDLPSKLADIDEALDSKNSWISFYFNLS